MAKNTVDMILNMTQEVVQRFFHRQADDLYEPMSDTMNWIGAFDFQWANNLEEFKALTASEMSSAQTIILSDEYHLVDKSHSFWVVKAKYHIVVILENGQRIDGYNRGTFIWKKMNGEIKLIHIHSSTTMDGEKELVTEEECHEDFMVFLQKTLIPKADYKLEFKTIDGSHHNFHPFEILYLQAKGKHGELHTKQGCYTLMHSLGKISENLPDYFLRIHKSYVVNSYCVKNIRRFQVDLINGECLPLGKERYRELRTQLQQANSDILEN